MSPIASISCDISNTDYSIPLGLEIWLDDNLLLNTESLDQPRQFECEIPDTVGEHCLRFVLKNKTDSHTKVNDQGQIIKDACIKINNLEFDNISLGHALTEIATYTHDFNGTGVITQQKFYGEMGCNGQVNVPFSTPIYMWMLDNL